MLGFFKKKHPEEEREAAIVAANNVACDFSDLIASDHIKPGFIYDVSVLPHSKTLIEKSCKLWISECRNESQRQGWKVVFPMLSQFQDGVGPTPLGLDISSVINAGLSPSEMAKRITTMKQPSPELLNRVRAEEQSLLMWVTQAIDGQP